jgi:hypothetical protein
MLTRIALTVLPALGLTFALTSQAFALGDYTRCIVSEVKDGGAFENEYDFSFSENLFVVVDLRDASNKVVSIGALSFAEKDANQASDIKIVDAYGAAGVEIAPQESDERFHLFINWRQGLGDVKRKVGNDYVPVATLDCK